MKNALSVLMIALLLSVSGSAQTYSCSVEVTDAWADEDAEFDSWTAEINLSKKTVQLSSYNEIFGPNPFAVLAPASSRGYESGTFVFRGKNKYEKSHSYTVSFHPDGEGSLESKEGRNQPERIDSLNCVRVK